MNTAAKSVYYFGYYLLALSIVLIAIPNFLLSTFQFPETNEVWIRVVGVLVLCIGIYYVYLAQSGSTLFLTLTVYIRASILIWFTAFVLLEWVEWKLILFGLVDFAGAVWTYLELKKK